MLQSAAVFGQSFMLIVVAVSIIVVDHVVLRMVSIGLSCADLWLLVDHLSARF